MLGRSQNQFSSSNRVRLNCELLEDRSVPATIMVNSGRDVEAGSLNPGEVTLRSAVGTAQTNGDANNTIIFGNIEYPVTFNPPIGYPPGLPPAPAVKLIVLTQNQPISMNITPERTLTIDGFQAGTTNIGVVVQRDTTGPTGGMLRFTGTGQLTINGIQFRDGHNNGNQPGGGAVYTESLFGRIDRCEFVNCQAFETDGGAVYNAGSLTLDHAGFYGNRSNRGGLVGFAEGGAVYNSGSLQAIWCTFKGNYATDFGGAIANYRINGSPATIGLGDCSFQDNTATRGGAIHAEGVVTSTSSEYLSNTAGTAGAIYSTAVLTVSGGVFEENDSTTDEGGAIRMQETAATLVINGNTTFRHNTAVKGGGAIAIVVNGLQIANNPQITGATFQMNSANAVEGGAIYASGGNGNLIVDNCLFEDNKLADATGALGGKGGAVSLSTWEGDFKSTTFRRNSAAQAGAVFVKQKPSKFDTCTFEDNMATGLAWTIGWDGPENANLVTIINCTGLAPDTDPHPGVQRVVPE